ncbi:MAG TPA: hypothetical protein VJK30_02395 [Coxiellaceae bacterium]|nr:MAG: hypothetical protein A3E81_08640 [Gammaproteobacteria bacterium RIFCSPHIGHO2_12_FULL_36_30]HLB56168.1 hypothetical protein [Coxiellaceae bacterium]
MSKRKNKNVSKNKIIQEEIDTSSDFDSSDFSENFDVSCDTHEEEASPRNMEMLIDANHFQSSLAFALTRLITENTNTENKTQENILNSFVAAQKTIYENSLLHSMLEKLSS